MNDSGVWGPLNQAQFDAQSSSCVNTGKGNTILSPVSVFTVMKCQLIQMIRPPFFHHHKTILRHSTSVSYHIAYGTLYVAYKFGMLSLFGWKEVYLPLGSLHVSLTATHPLAMQPIFILPTSLSNLSISFSNSSTHSQTQVNSLSIHFTSSIHSPTSHPTHLEYSFPNPPLTINLSPHITVMVNYFKNWVSVARVVKWHTTLFTLPSKTYPSVLILTTQSVLCYSSVYIHFCIAIHTTPVAHHESLNHVG